GYALYFLIWCSIIVLFSSIVRTPGASLGALLVTWVVVAMLVPPMSSTVATSVIKAPGKIETDFAVLEAIKKIGDGHNAADPAFTQLRKNMLQQYGVETIEELPINFRGVVARAAEADLTDTLNKFAEERMSVETSQARVARHFGWLSPVLGIREFSMTMAGVNLETHHKFLRETEKLRFDFVQSLNKAHAEQLAYSDDINRSNDPDAEKRTRISAENWKALETFKFSPYPASERMQASFGALLKLLTWLAVLLLLCRTIGRRAL
ncbi:MAG: DUF3526 domain-containing protein, partial [Kordiimonas sp.]